MVCIAKGGDNSTLPREVRGSRSKFIREFLHACLLGWHFSAQNCTVSEGVCLRKSIGKTSLDNSPKGQVHSRSGRKNGSLQVASGTFPEARLPPGASSAQRESARREARHPPTITSHPHKRAWFNVNRHAREARHPPPITRHPHKRARFTVNRHVVKPATRHPSPATRTSELSST